MAERKAERMASQVVCTLRLVLRLLLGCASVQGLLRLPWPLNNTINLLLISGTTPKNADSVTCVPFPSLSRYASNNASNGGQPNPGASMHGSGIMGVQGAPQTLKFNMGSGNNFIVKNSNIVITQATSNADN